MTWAGGVAAILAAGTLVLGIAGLVMRYPSGRCWLAVLFGINAGYGEVSHETLRALPPVDVLLLLLAGTTYAAFWPGPGTSHAWWMVLAIAQPLLGIAILLATRLAGRSGLMGGAFVLSLLMLFSDAWAAVGWLGLTASVLLLVADFGTTGRPHRPLAPILAVGYAALITWFSWVGALLLG